MKFRPRFYIRDMLWLTLMIGMGIGWWMDAKRVTRYRQVFQELQRIDGDFKPEFNNWRRKYTEDPLSNPENQVFPTHWPTCTQKPGLSRHGGRCCSVVIRSVDRRHWASAPSTGPQSIVSVVATTSSRNSTPGSPKGTAAAST